MSLILGLDITKNAVRGAFVRTTFRGAEVEHYAEAPVYQTPDPERHAEALAQAVASVLAEVPRPPDRIIADIDGQDASLRVVELPAGVAKKLAAVLPGELETVLPFDIEDAVIDHQVVAQDNGMLRVLAAAVPALKVRERLEALDGAGASPWQLAVGAAALDGIATLLPEWYENETVLLVDIGARTTDLCVLENGRCSFARTISGGLDLVDGGRRAVLGQALKQTFASFRTQSDQVPTIALCSGEASPMDEATKWLSEQLEIPCEVLPLPDAPGAEPDVMPRFARAAALAGRVVDRRKRLDLRQGEFAAKGGTNQLQGHGRLLGVCGLALLVAFGFSVVSRHRVAASEREVLMEQLTKVTQELFRDKATSAAHARELLTATQGPTDPLPRFDAYDALAAVSSSIPMEMKHETRRIVIEVDDEDGDGRLELQGTIETIAERDQIVETLKSHDCFESIEKGSISTVGDNRRSYKLEVSIACPNSSKPDKGGRRGTR